MNVNEVHFGDCRETMRSLIADGVRVQMCVTSPPYFGLRDYGTEPVEWLQVEYMPMAGLPRVTVPAMRASLGLEPDPNAYVGHLVSVFRQVQELLADDGVLWLNMGDSFASGGGTGAQGKRGQRFERRHTQEHLGINRAHRDFGLKPKDLIGIPWRVAYALQADGWYLRQDIIWHKPNPMPESVTDRCTKAHEYVFLLSKGERYYYEATAISESVAWPEQNRFAEYETTFLGTRHHKRVFTRKPSAAEIKSARAVPSEVVLKEQAQTFAVPCLGKDQGETSAPFGRCPQSRIPAPTSPLFPQH